MTADVPENFFTLQWKFNANLVLVTYLPDKEPTVSPVYTGRIETDVKKYSVKVKNVQKADSGVYTITVTGTARTQILAEYDVRVQGPVSPVELSVDSSVSSSSDSCNLTVTCRTQDSNISSTFTCDNQTCSPEGGERSEVTTSGASLHVYLLNDSIICNHSNQVSWTEDIKKAEHFCPQHAGSSAVTPVFVQKGKDVLLNVMTADVPENFFILSWRFNQKDVLVTFFPDKEPTVSNNYTGRIETDVKKYSLKLNNLQEADSGVYTARVTGSEEERILAEYNVTVQGPVSPVELSVDSVSNSSDSCNLTVTCRTQDSHISRTFTCDTQTCRQEGGERSEVTTSAASLHVYLLNDSIICNHSNQVSWTEDIKKAEHFCPQHADQDKQHNNIIVPVLCSFSIVFIATVAAVCCYRKRRKYKRRYIKNTVYETVQATTYRLNQIPTDDTSGVSPTSTYYLVGPHTGPVGSPERGRTLPESLYAHVKKSARA
ncbi:uncharacterized protein LOC123972080 [Micropterus dolomieu]|uniref:uncharacterized protein LOC123972080 n=1 Tax=Micropterus dolomieu TaxID=147949 RepID=UPI001E8E723A|nr:uncharacterized protein LOC123972080 [Micropterus dolomieu]